MLHTPVDLHFLDARGDDHVVRAFTAEGHGWRVEVSLGEQTFTRYCSSWQAVEHTVGWLRRHAHESRPENSRSTSGPIAAAMAALLIAIGAGIASAQPVAREAVQPSADDPVAAFTAATREYAAMHRRIEQALGPMAMTVSPDKILRHIEFMAAGIRQARPDAHQGDLFTPALAPLLRERIATALADHDYTADDVRAAQMDEVHAPLLVPRLKVYDSFPWIIGSAMFPCVLEALPALPPELQYRFVGDDLLLIDVHASLIVDILPFALARTHTVLFGPAFGRV